MFDGRNWSTGGQARARWHNAIMAAELDHLEETQYCTVAFVELGANCQINVPAPRLWTHPYAHPCAFATRVRRHKLLGAPKCHTIWLCDMGCTVPFLIAANARPVCGDNDSNQWLGPQPRRRYEFHVPT